MPERCRGFVAGLDDRTSRGNRRGPSIALIARRVGGPAGRREMCGGIRGLCHGLAGLLRVSWRL
jgi:hypothetical protein